MGIFKRIRGEIGLPSCCKGILGFPLESLQVIRTYLKLRGHSMSFFLEADSVGFHSRFNR